MWINNGEENERKEGVKKKEKAERSLWYSCQRERRKEKEKEKSKQKAVLKSFRSQSFKYSSEKTGQVQAKGETMY